MLISDSHEFIFVRVRKTASRSMRSQLEPYLLPRPSNPLARIKSRAMLEKDYRKFRFRAHDKITTAQKVMAAERFQRYFKFAIVRNPWSRLVSEYEFILRTPGHGRHRKVKKLRSFAAFVEMQIPRMDAYQTSQLCDGDGRLLMDYVGRLGNLQNDWQAICARIDIPCSGLPMINVGNSRPYVEYFTPKLRDLVAQHWSREIEMFGLEFETGP